MSTSLKTSLLIVGLNSGGSLFRHEIAFVLGQLAEPVSVPALRAALADLSQHEMVRHECAEALGAVATTDCLEVIYSSIYSIVGPALLIY